MPAQPGTAVSLSAQGVGDGRVGDEGTPEVTQGWGRLQEGPTPKLERGYGKLFEGRGI